MPLDQASAAAMQMIKSIGGPPIHECTAEQARSRMLKRETGPVEEVQSVEDRTIPGPLGEIPVRIYKPATKPGMQLSALVYIHGGGFVMGNLDSHDHICRALANGVPCIVVSVDYRLAPEHPFPAAVDDCYAAAQWVSGNASALGADSGLVAIGGDSAGGNLSAVASVLARDRNGPKLVFQLLYYPCTDITDPKGPHYPSQSEYATGSEGLLNTKDAEWMINKYIPDHAQRKDPRFAVLRSDLKGLPPALVLTAEVDPLRDEGEAFAEKLKAAGCDVEFQNFDGTFHGFMSFPVPQAKEGMELSVQALRKAFGMHAEE